MREIKYNSNKMLNCGIFKRVILKMQLRGWEGLGVLPQNITAGEGGVRGFTTKYHGRVGRGPTMDSTHDKVKYKKFQFFLK
jgi:hypothetical protein